MRLGPSGEAALETAANRFNKLLLVFAALVLLVTALALITGDPSLWWYLTMLGEEEPYVVLAILVYYTSPSPLTGLAALTSVVASGLLNIAVKYTLNTPRPPNPLIGVEGPGFPSGHVQVSASFWTAVTCAHREAGFIALAVSTVVAISLSRVALRAHYHFDVIGGAALGVLAGLLTHLAAKGGSRARATSVWLAIVALGAYNALYCGAELESTSALLGLGLASTTLLLAPKATTRLDSVAARLLGFTASSTLLVAVNTATLGANAAIRVLGFTLGGVASLSLIPRALVECSRRCHRARRERSA